MLNTTGKQTPGWEQRQDSHNVMKTTRIMKWPLAKLRCNIIAYLQSRGGLSLRHPSPRPLTRLNRLRTGVGRFGANTLHWGLAKSDSYEQTADHISSGPCPHLPPNAKEYLLICSYILTLSF